MTTQQLADLATEAGRHLDLARRATAAGFIQQAHEHLGHAHTAMGHLLMACEDLTDTADYGRRLLRQLLNQGEEMTTALAGNVETA